MVEKKWSTKDYSHLNNNNNNNFVLDVRFLKIFNIIQVIDTNPYKKES